MPRVDYPLSLRYKPIAGAGLVPAAEITLHYGGRETRAVAEIDSGSALTIFSAEHAQLLGIDDVLGGDAQKIATLSSDGGFHVYMFQMEIEVRIEGYSRRFPAQVGFSAGRIPRNILGRNIFFEQYEVGFRERQQIVHIRPESQDP